MGLMTSARREVFLAAGFFIAGVLFPTAFFEMTGFFFATTAFFFAPTFFATGDFFSGFVFAPVFFLTADFFRVGFFLLTIFFLRAGFFLAMPRVYQSVVTSASTRISSPGACSAYGELSLGVR